MTNAIRLCCTYILSENVPMNTNRNLAGSFCMRSWRYFEIWHIVCWQSFFCDLKFVDDTHYAIRPLAFQIAPTALGVGYNVKEKPQYSFFDSIPDSGLSKNLVKVVLVCPVSGTLQYNDLNVGCGESMGEALCYTTSSFLKELISQAWDRCYRSWESRTDRWVFYRMSRY